MLGPLPPLPSADRPELPRVRLDVRAAVGAAAARTPPRPVSYEVGSDEFLIGGTGGCDLRLPTPNLPPVIAQISRKPDGVRVRRLTPILQVLLNGSPVPANAPAPLASGDVLGLAGVEITVHIHHAAFLSPRFVPAEPEPLPVVDEPPPPAFRLPPQSDSDLVRRARELDRQTEDLEADRVLWYRRRGEMEAEYERHRALMAETRARVEQLDAREEELNRLHEELAARQEELQEASAQLQNDRGAAEADLERRRAELQAELESHRRRLDEEAARQREAFEDELRERRASVEAELAVHEPKLRELREQRERLAAASQELDRQRELFAADREILDRARDTFEAGRAAETERLTTWEKTLTEREAEVARRLEQLREDHATLERDREQFRDDLVRLERRAAAVEEQERRAEEQTRGVEVRLEQLKRDSAEWEETVRLATAEQERLRAEAERLDRQKTELDAQSSILAERAGQLEAQQAVLAVLRSKLDRTRQEAEREVSQLAAARTREDESLAELRARIREAEELRAELAAVQADTARERDRLEERDSLLAAGLEEIRLQREALAAEAVRLQARESELDVRSAEFAEQAGTLKGRVTQAFDLQARLEADRVAIREREAALAQAEEARATLQEQLRRRAEDLTARAKALDEVARQIAADRVAVDQARSATEADRLTTLQELDERRKAIDARAAEVERLAADYAEKEQALARQVGRLKDVGAAVAAERKSLAELRAKWEADRVASAEADAQAREELAAFRSRALAEIEELRRQAPELETQANAALERLSSARDMLRGHLTELHDFARLSREDLAAIRTQVRQEAERLREQEESLNRAKAEHRLAVTAFRQQLIDWQGQVGDMKRTLAGSEARLDAKQAAVEAATKQADATTAQLAEQAEQLRRERAAVSERRSEVERHLGDMREWYRKKLRELAGSGGEAARSRGGDDPPALKLHDATAPPHHLAEELDPGDRQLGELLRSHALVDGDTLDALWAEAARQRKTLRQVLLVSGAVTLYQLALIEAGNLDALMVGRFRVIDRLRVTPREAIYRVFDPARAAGRTPGAGDGVFLLRHLAEPEMHDAVHPDEFRQRFAAARDSAHPNLAGVLEVLEIGGRPAVLQEWLTGLFSADWPAQAAHPGCWLRLASMAAQGLDTAHRHGLVHGRLTSDSFLLTPEGVLKITGFGEPPWLASPGSPVPAEASAAADLRAFGQVLFVWSQFAARQKKPGKPKPFPEELLAIVRRLEADPEPPMADTVAAERPYGSGSELVADLERLAGSVAFSEDAWEKLLRHVAENAPDAPPGLKRSA